MNRDAHEPDTTDRPAADPSLTVAPLGIPPGRHTQAARRLGNVEVDRLVRSFLNAGGQVTRCPPGDAMLVRSPTLADRLRRAERLIARRATSVDQSNTPGPASNSDPSAEGAGV